MNKYHQYLSINDFSHPISLGQSIMTALFLPTRLAKTRLPKTRLAKTRQTKTRQTKTRPAGAPNRFWPIIGPV
jgi:hypothetical protein